MNVAACRSRLRTPRPPPSELRARFTQAGYLVYSVKARNALGASSTRKKVKLQNFLVFNQQFVTLIKAGLPIPGSLELLARRQKDINFKAQLENVAARVKTGESLSSAFDAQGGFPLIFTTTLLAGERSGNLEEVLQRYADFQRVSLQRDQEAEVGAGLSRAAHHAGHFAVCLSDLVCCAALCAALRPVERAAARHHAAAAEGGQRRTVVRPLRGAAAWSHWAGYLLYRWSKTDAGASTVDKLRLGIPLLGVIWLKYQVALFSRTLSTLLTGGLPLVPSLETAARSISSRQVSNAVFSSVTQVREGQRLSTSLEGTRVFPELAIEMIEVGESTGALPAMLNSVAGFFEEDVDTSLAGVLSLIEPTLLIFMGVVVAVILISLYLPILQLGAGVNGAQPGQ